MNISEMERWALRPEKYKHDILQYMDIEALKALYIAVRDVIDDRVGMAWRLDELWDA